MSFESVVAETDRAVTLDASIIALANGLAAEIERLKQDPAALQALADKLRSSNDAVEAAVLAHTPQAPPEGGGDPAARRR